MPNQSRKFARAVVQLVARYRSPTVFNFVEEECYDLSTGGMFIKSDAPASPGTLLKLECDEEGGDGRLKAIARVVWIRAEEDMDGPGGMGVKFVKVDPGGHEVIVRLTEGRTSMLPGGERFRGSSIPPARRQQLASLPPEALAEELPGGVDGLEASTAPTDVKPTDVKPTDVKPTSDKDPGLAVPTSSPDDAEPSAHAHEAEAESDPNPASSDPTTSASEPAEAVASPGEATDDGTNAPDAESPAQSGPSEDTSGTADNGTDNGSDNGSAGEDGTENDPTSSDGRRNHNGDDNTDRIGDAGRAESDEQSGLSEQPQSSAQCQSQDTGAEAQDPAPAAGVPDLADGKSLSSDDADSGSTRPQSEGSTEDNVRPTAGSERSQDPGAAAGGSPRTAPAAQPADGGIASGPTGDRSGLWMGIGAAAVLGIAVLAQGLFGGAKPPPPPSAALAHAPKPASKSTSISESSASPTAPHSATEPKTRVGHATGAAPDSKPALKDSHAEKTTAEGSGTGAAASSGAAAPDDATGPPPADAKTESKVDSNTKTSTEPSQPAAQPQAAQARYVLTVITRPASARLDVGPGVRISATQFAYDTFDAPLRVRADKKGFQPTATTVKPADFEADGDVMRRRIFLRLRPKN